ncbi:MAG: SDR family oxidoreductase [Alphaproteobacteria bacterium]|nr:SDR family oxidoreductase [Alphaproteobacteria bacterium]
MKLALFGATGKTGQAFLDLALAASHEIVALVRDPAKLAPRPGLAIVAGDARDDDAVRRAVDGTEAVVSLLGSFNRKPNTEVSDASQRIVTAMRDAGVERLVVCSTIGVGDSFAPMRSRLFKLIIRTLARHIWADRERQERIVRGSGLDWTIVRPGGLRDTPATGRWTLIGSGDPQPAKVAIARADVAACLLAAIADPALSRRTVCLYTDAAA